MRSGRRVASVAPVRSRPPPTPPPRAGPYLRFRVGFARHRDRFQHIPQSVKVTDCSLSGGSLHSSAALLHASAISRLICITTPSMLRLTTMSRLQRAAMPDRCVSVMPAIWSISSLTSSCRTGLRCFSSILMRSNAAFAKACSASAAARRLLPLASQISEVGNTALVEREAITLPLDHAIGFELADIGPAAIEVQRQRRSTDGDGGPIDGDGLSHERHSCCVAVGYSVWSVSGRAALPSQPNCCELNSASAA